MTTFAACTIAGILGGHTLGSTLSGDVTRGLGTDTLKGRAAGDRLSGSADNYRLDSWDSVNDSLDRVLGTDPCATDATEASLTTHP